MTVEELSRSPLILLWGERERRDLRLRWVEPEPALPVCYVNNEDNATFLVARGLGVSILPHSPEPTYPGQVVRAPIEPPVYHELALAVRDLQEAPPAVRRFVRFAREWFSAREEREREGSTFSV